MYIKQSTTNYILPTKSAFLQIVCHKFFFIFLKWLSFDVLSFHCPVGVEGANVRKKMSRQLWLFCRGMKFLLILVAMYVLNALPVMSSANTFNSSKNATNEQTHSNHNNMCTLSISLNTLVSYYLNYVWILKTWKCAQCPQNYKLTILSSVGIFNKWSGIRKRKYTFSPEHAADQYKVLRDQNASNEYVPINFGCIVEFFQNDIQSNVTQVNNMDRKIK
ncbi:hypothetical protein RFI_32879 [Reticulomyxa filosa]|uniref:Uncharacterized protein n=1 Tax=Reticulomyxa filosa TaxID=46433 RepID=X6LRL3_RETFI|nr:hypothetical protein RFI_32879 [Reticulomyxa filosa]|eukprot:ETO04518.1 hypothetical protein RFI_32879 [Reticulomyxa filosa]